jgi:hypothetical protein
MHTKFPEILRKTGSTNERLKEVLTSVAPDAQEGPMPDEDSPLMKDVRNRKRLEDSIASKTHEGMSRSLRNAAPYSAADMAYDTDTITRDRYPLSLYAKGKITVDRCREMLGPTTSSTYQKYTRRTEGQAGDKVHLPAFVEAPVNLVKSFVNRRWAPQKVKFENLFPYLRYEPRTTGPVAELKADAVSQIMEIMADNFGYRHSDSQAVLGGLLYSHSIDFVARAWTCDMGYDIEDVVEEIMEGKDTSESFKLKSRVVREGVEFASPHPSRVYSDTNYPLSMINFDHGPQYIGFWDVKRYSDVYHDPDFFNVDNIGTGDRLWDLFGSYPEYFSTYMSTIREPVRTTVDPSLDNDRKSTVGFYSIEKEDESILVTEHYERIIPLEYGIGDYPHPIWVHFTIASDDRIVFAEFLPSRPACYLGINEHDGRERTASFAMDLLPFQDHATNIATHSLRLLALEIFKVIEINADRLYSPNGKQDEAAKALEEIRGFLKSDDFFKNPCVLTIESSLEKLKELAGGAALGDLIKIHEVKVTGSIAAGITAMGQLISLAERLTAMSPAEQGQPAPREISAREVTAIEGTTSSVYNSISDAIDNFRSAKKRILHDSWLAYGQPEFEVAVAARYPENVITDAGFEIVQGEGEIVDPNGARRHTIKGRKTNLQFPMVYSSRDGSERASNPEMAATLAQLTQFIFQEPTGSVLQAMGKPRLFELMNTVVRLSDAGFDLNLKLEPGEDPSFGQSSEEMLTEAVQRIAQTIQQMQQQDQRIDQELGLIKEAIGSVGQVAENAQLANESEKKD